jgi:HEPN domain-containing protein
MAGQLSTKRIIRRDDLREIADSRLKEAELLGSQGYHGACVYLAGYSVECYLKYAICRQLDLDELLALFSVHDLEGLLLCSGLDKQFRSNANVEENFRRVCSVWSMEGTRSVRYRRPSEFTPEEAKEFLSYINDPAHGVVVWLKKNIP